MIRRSDRRQTIISVSLPHQSRLKFAIAILVSSFFFFAVYVTLPPRENNKNNNKNNDNDNNHHHDSTSSLSKANTKLRQRITTNNNDAQIGKTQQETHRLAIIILFVGENPGDIPSYLGLFCATAEGSASLVDFLLVHDGVLDLYQEQQQQCSRNVLFHSLGSVEGIARELIKVVDHKPERELKSGGSQEKLVRFVTNYIQKYPYALVEFKPALGHIFQQYLKGYTHWGYSDLDIMFGDLKRWITSDELTKFDIVTYGFGDQHRIYLRGQFTIHRNDPKIINQLWRPCSYLSDMDTRFFAEESLQFESAEGCYSAAVLDRDDIRIKYAVKAFTDAEQESKEDKDRDTAYTHGIYVATGMGKNRTIIYKAGMNNRRGLSTVSHNWFETYGSIYADPEALLYKPIGERERLPTVEKENTKCMYWVQKKYQSKLCVDGVNTNDTVYWIKGQLYKEKFELAKLPGDIVTAPFFHFQEWKRYYRKAQLGGFQRNGPFAGFVLSKEGVLPFYLDNTKQNRVHVNNEPSPLGVNLFQWHGIESGNRKQLPHNFYCLQLDMKPPFTKCKFMTSWRDTSDVEILSGAPAWSTVDAELEVTMAITLQLHADQLDDSEATQGFFTILTYYLNRWQGQPMVIVIHVAGATSEFATTVRLKLGPDSNLSNFGMETVLVGCIFSDKPDTFSRKALMNMAIDASPTRFVMAGYELERGIIPSRDTSYLVHRTAQIYKNSPGSVHIVPQFGLVDGDHEFTMGALEQARLDGRLRPLSKVEEGECEGDNANIEKEEDSVVRMIEEMWWKLSQHPSNHKLIPTGEMAVEKQSLALENIQIILSSLLSEKEHYNLYAADASPIFLFDNIGPNAGMVSTDIVREIDEFGGKLCYNIIRLAQMATLGYHINILAGVYAISIPAIRDTIGDPNSGPLGVSRCDGCFFFTKEKKHEDILENISLEERSRPAKIALLWD